LSDFVKLLDCSHIELYKILNLLKKHRINPIVKDFSKSSSLAGFGNLSPNYVEVYVHKDQLKKSLKVLEN
tara:strand:+ start:515 stop:724 length:210 start_codon:yes stop_codon:yes gene_type:complete